MTKRLRAANDAALNAGAALWNLLHVSSFEDAAKNSLGRTAICGNLFRARQCRRRFNADRSLDQSSSSEASFYRVDSLVRIRPA